MDMSDWVIALLITLSIVSFPYLIGDHFGFKRGVDAMESLSCDSDLVKELDRQ